MKKLIPFLIAILAGLSLSASHYAGAEINYEYLSTNANGSHQYKVHLQIYRDTSGIAVNLTNQRICIRSSCYSQQDVLLTFLPVTSQNGGNIRQALPVPDLTACVSSADPDLVKIEIYFFEATVTLPGNCPDFKFSWHGNARNTNNIDNLTFAGSCGSDLYVEALLNNGLGQNTSPVFINPAAKAFCAGSPFTWSQAATEPDNDSLFYGFANPLNSPFSAGGCVTSCQATFAPGYNVQQPMSTVSGITIDNKTGTFYFTPSQIETDVVCVQVEEYRYNNVTAQWLLIGTTLRDLQIPIVGSCLPSTTAGPKIDINSTGFSQETIDADSIRSYLHGLGFVKAVFDSTIVPPSHSIAVVDYQCGDSVISLHFNVDVICSSISNNGTEFRLVGPDSNATPIPAVQYSCNPDLTTNDINLILHQPLSINGDYYLQIKNGDDGNTLQNECGFSLTPFYTIKIKVSGCKTPVYNLENVTVVKDSTIQIDWSVVDTTLNSKLFTSWAILKSLNNQYWVVDNISDIHARSYVDLSVKPSDVDTYKYNYAVQLVENYNALVPSNTINNILLEYDKQESFTRFFWNDYDGWQNPDYTIEYTLVSSSMNWQSLSGPSPSLKDFSYQHPEIDQNTAGTYAFRIIASDPAGVSNYVSESNWVYLLFEHTPDNDEEPYVSGIPNIITPNGDLQNDQFYFDINTYSNMSLSVYNRWGDLVYQDLNSQSENYTNGKGWDGTNQQTGKPLSDGVYYYLISLSDKTTGKSEELKGPITIIKGHN